MDSSWLASFVLIVVLLGLGGLVTAAVWVALLLLSRWDQARGGGPSLLGRERDPADLRAGVGQRGPARSGAGPGGGTCRKSGWK